MANLIQTITKGLRRGRRAHVPDRETQPFARLQQLLSGQPFQKKRPVFKPTPWNLRAFSRSVYARRAINAIKNPIANLGWEIRPDVGMDWNSELQRQAAIVVTCLRNPNLDDTFSTMIQQIAEDIMLGAGACEMRMGGDDTHPIWLYPVDGLSIQIYPAWAGGASEARYCQVPGYGTQVGGEMRIDLRNDELMYIRPNPSTATPFGTGPLEVAFNSISRQLGVSDYAGSLASNAKPNTILNLGKATSTDDLLKFRQYWKGEIEGTGVMPIGAFSDDAAAIKLSPDGDNAMYLKWQEFLKSEIATAFDLSPMNLGVERDVNRNTAEVGEDRDWEQAIKPFALMIASKLTGDIIKGNLGFSQLNFVWVGLDREDEDQQAQIYDKYYKINVLTPNEIREKIGMEPADNMWADKTFADTQVAMTAARNVARIDDSDLDSDGATAQPQPAAKTVKSKPKGK